ncbi:MAG: aminotransferase class IV [Clostridia bacterium]|nr:aminotransferase class IV [Clostridia bacterium]
MKSLGYYNGKVGLIEEISVPITDRAFYFGDGVYDAVMCRNNIPYLLDEHVERIFTNCKLLKINPPIGKGELSDLICDLVKRVDGKEKFVYFHISRGSGIRDHSFTQGKGNLCIMIKKQAVDNVMEKMDLTVSQDIRYKLCNIKTLNLLPSVLSAQEATEKNCQESVFVRDGYVTECSHSNISILKSGILITAPADCHILPGVTRAHLISVALKNGIRVEEKKYTLDELYDADEIIVTSSSKLARGAKTVNGKQVGGKDNSTYSFLRDAIYNEYISKTSI